jgi:hypothetical protein
MPSRRPQPVSVRLVKALKLVKSGKSVRFATRKENVAPSTLQDRVSGGGTRQKSHEKRQVLSPAQESVLLRWIKDMEKIGFPVQTAVIRAMAAEISSTEVGRTWADKFMERHPELKRVRASSLDQLRHDVTPASIAVLFDRYSQFRAKYHLLDANIWNMDESGIQVGSSSRFKRVIVSAETSGVNFTVPSGSGSTRLVSIVEAVNVKGNSAPPLFVTQGKTFVESITPEDGAFLHTKRYFLARTANAFMTQETGGEWLEKCFLPYTKPEANEHSAQPWRMLILDGHTSHVSEKFMVTAYLNRVCLLFLPSHGTHMLQPLDLVVFGDLKRRYHDALYKRTSEGELHIDLPAFYRLYDQIRRNALCARNCKSAFKKAGLIPVDRSIPLSKAKNPPPQASKSDESAPPPPSSTLEDGRTILKQFYEEGQIDSILEIYEEERRKREAAEAEVCTLKFMLQRAQNELKDTKKAKRSTRRIPTSPNSKFLSHRGLARSRGQIASSPPSSPVRPRDSPPPVDDEFPDLPSPMEPM